MNKKIHLLCFIVIIACGLASCRQFNILFKPTPYKHSEWVTKWLYEPNCQPPCYEEMSPGKTTIEEALIRINELVGTPNRTYFPGSPRDRRKQISWQFENQSGGGSAKTDMDGEIISDITIQPGEGLGIAEIFSIYGPPDEVNIVGCFGELVRSDCVVHLIYSSIGMVLEISLPDGGKEEYIVEIKPDSDVFRIIFFSPGNESYIRALGVFDYIEKWSGYTSYRLKYP